MGTVWEAKCLQMRTRQVAIPRCSWAAREGQAGSVGKGLQDWECSTTSAEVLLAFYKEMLIKD